MKVLAAVPSGDLSSSVETSNRPSESGPYIFIARGAVAHREFQADEMLETKFCACRNAVD